MASFGSPHDPSGHCRVCNALIENDSRESAEQIEKSTRIILGLLSHYSGTLLNVIKKGPPPQSRGVSMQNFGGYDSDDEDAEEEKVTICNKTCLLLSIASVVIVGALIGMIVLVVRVRSTTLINGTTGANGAPSGKSPLQKGNG
ncbi:unnamed protein product [Amoebophrya sp. A25]|nr:unnamed protein product [Amoebophrya sp. A25]|eukprot:GSA25T00000005001.1